MLAQERRDRISGAWESVFDPIPLPEKRDNDRRFFAIGGCGFWLVFGLFVMMAYIMAGFAIAIWIALVVVLRVVGATMVTGWHGSALLVSSIRGRRG